MRSRLGLNSVLVVVGACSFSAANDVTDDGVDAGADPDAADVPPVAIVPCNTPDATGVVLCLEFEDGVADDMLYDSSPARRKVTTHGLFDFDRAPEVKSVAAYIGADSRTYVPQDASLELGAGYTLAAWVYADTSPGQGDVRGIIDHERQYAMYLKGQITTQIAHYCANTGVDTEWTGGLVEDTWSFLACTWNGGELCAYRWSSPTDHEAYCHFAAAPAASGAQGLAIGHLSDLGQPHSRFDGKLDSVQVYGRGLTKAQLCAMIGQGPSCM